MDANIILDIRTKKEYCSGHVCNSINIPTPLPPVTKKSATKLFNKLNNFITENKINPKTPILLYCKKGIRAEQAKIFLEQLGMKNVKNLGGVEKNPLKQLMKNESIVCYCK